MSDTGEPGWEMQQWEIEYQQWLESLDEDRLDDLEKDPGSKHGGVAGSIHSLPREHTGDDDAPHGKSKRRRLSAA